MSGQTRAEYLKSEIQRLQGAIAHLENAGCETFNNAPPSVFKNEEKEWRRQRENHSPEIYEKSGEDFLADLKEDLSAIEAELAELQRQN